MDSKKEIQIKDIDAVIEESGEPDFDSSDMMKAMTRDIEKI
jgi:hypothetical protein